MSIMNKALSILKLKISPEKFHYFGLSTRTKIHRSKKNMAIKTFWGFKPEIFKMLLECTSSACPYDVKYKPKICRLYTDTQTC